MRRHLPDLLAQAPVAILAAWIAILLVRTALPRLVYPFDLEWMEGGMLVHAWRLRRGLGLYVPPSADFVPFIYPPLYPWLLSLLGEPSYLVGRALSLGASFLAALLAAAAARGERLPAGLCLGAAGLFISCYEQSGTFYDLVRTDGVAMALLGAALVLARRGSRSGVAAGGLLLAIGFAAKQSAALFGIPVLIWLWRRRGRRRAALFACASAGPALVFVLAMELHTRGLFLTYLLGVPATHPLVGPRGWPGAAIELWKALPWTTGAAAAVLLAWCWPARRARWLVLAGAGGLAAVASLHLSKPVMAGVSVFPALLVAWGLASAVRRRGLGEGASYWSGVALCAALVAGLMRAHHGGYLNVLIPAHWALAVGGILVLDSARRRAGGRGALLVVSCLVAWQTWAGRWEPRRTRPTPADVEGGRMVIDAIAAVDGEVLVPHAPFYPLMAGKKPSFPLIALWDIDHRGGPLRSRTRAIDQAFSEKRWAAVITTGKDLGHGMRRTYRRARRIPVPAGAFRTRTGWPVRPVQVWEPRPDAEDGGAGAAGSGPEQGLPRGAP